MTNKVQKILQLIDELDAHAYQGSHDAVEKLKKQIEAQLREVVAPPVPESYEELWNALQAIDTAACQMSTFEVLHEGGIEAVTKNIIAAIEATTPQPASGPFHERLDDEDLATLVQIDQDFEDAEETSVDYDVLMRFARMGYLECTHFTVTSTGRAAISAKKGQP